MFSIDIPPIKQYTGQICCECGGIGKTEGIICFICQGEGKKFIYDWRRAYGISASLSLFFIITSLYEKETNAGHPQFLTIETNTSREAHGGSLCGEISEHLSRLIDKLVVNGKNNVAEAEMLFAMKTANERMFRTVDMFGYYDAHLKEKGRFSIYCPGDRCGLYPSGEYIYSEKWGTILVAIMLILLPNNSLYWLDWRFYRVLYQNIGKKPLL